MRSARLRLVNVSHHVRTCTQYPELIKVVRSKEQDMMDKIRRGNFDASDLDADASPKTASPEEAEAEADGDDVVEVRKISF